MHTNMIAPRWRFGLVFAVWFGTIPAAAAERPTVLVVVGAEGTPEFGALFRTWAARWEEAAKQAEADCYAIGLADAGDERDRDALQKQLTMAARQTDEPLWLVLIGHGTFDGKTARFNLRGPDVAVSELREWLTPVARPTVVLGCFSSSAPWLPELSSPGRVVITATKSGYEHNFSRLGDYLSAAVVDPAADLDKDDQTSILEAWLLASSRLGEFYKQDGRLATEHALLDDNGDKLGTPADWFKGVRAIKTAKDGAAPDGLRAMQLAIVQSSREEQLSAETRGRRDALEMRLSKLREQKVFLSEDEYLDLIEPVLIELAELYESAKPRTESQ
jgi:hypothetical protein